MTERSANEIAFMVTKAARGAGLPLAHADDLGAAAIWLCGDLAHLCAALEAASRPRGNGTIAVLDAPSALTHFLADPSEPLVLNDVDHPALVNALAQEAAAVCGVGISCEIRANRVTCMQSHDHASPAPSGRADVNEAVWDRLAALAARTFVPASDASRLAGAGAGLNDND